jgi:hypothetical protein
MTNYVRLASYRARHWRPPLGPPMPPQVRLRDDQLAQLAQLLQEDAATLDSLVESLRRLPTSTFTVKELKDAAAKVISDESATTLARVVVLLGSYCRRYGADGPAAVNSLDRGIALSSEWTHDQKTDWGRRLRPALDRIMQLESIHVLVKAIDLAFDYANVFATARIITDIRPIFDEHRDTPIGVIVSNIMRLEYMAGSQPINVSVALDKPDLERLRDACIEALRKMAKIHEFMDEPKKLRTVDTGEDIYELGR